MKKVQAPLKFKKGDKVSVVLCGKIWYNGTITNAEIKRGLKPYTIEDEDGNIKWANEEFVYKLSDIDFTISIKDFVAFKNDFKANGLKLTKRGKPFMKEFNSKLLPNSDLLFVEFMFETEYFDKIVSMISKYAKQFNAQ